MPVIRPEVTITMVCLVCKARTRGELAEDGSDEIFPSEEGWVTIRVSEIKPNPDREIEAQLRRDIEEQTGQTILEGWDSPPHFGHTHLEAGCPKHAGKIKALLGLED